MGMDVFGVAPRNETGEYFRNNVWWWRPLWDYCEQVIQKHELPLHVEYAQSNDGDGLDDEGAKLLAQALTIELDSGQTMLYEIEYTGQQEQMPDKVCHLCNGDERGALIQEGWYDYVEGQETFRNPCNACQGKGTERPTATWYPFSEENVLEFRNFLLHCGGFQIC